MNDLSMLDINPATDFLVSDFQNGGLAVQTLQLDEILQSHFAQHPAETAFGFSVIGDFSQAGITFGGHPLSCAIALANLEVFEREDLVGRVQRYQDEFRERCDVLLEEHPMVGDVRGDGYFYSLELVKDKDTKETFTPAERDELIKTFLLPRTRELGVYMRFDDRGETCAQFAPPLVAGPEEFDEMVGVLRQVLDEAWDRVNTKVGA